MSCFVAMVAVVVQYDAGWRSRVPVAVAALDDARMPVIPFHECDEKGPQPYNVQCIIGQLNSPRLALIWGDSHAIAWAPGLDVMLKQEGVKGILAVNSGCAPVLGLYNPKDRSCLQDNVQVMGWLKQNPVERVYLIASWTSWSVPGVGYALHDEAGQAGNGRIFPPALKRTISVASSYTHRIILIGPTPDAPDELPLRLALHQWKGTPLPSRVLLSEVLNENKWFWQAVNLLKPSSTIQLVDPTVWFCGDVYCRYYTETEGLLYRDGNHLSVAGSGFAVDRLAKVNEAETVAGKESR